MRMAWVAVLWAVLGGSPARGQHGGHEGHGMMPVEEHGGRAHDDRERSRRDKLARLQGKIDGIDEALADPGLPPKKRAKLEKKLKKLLEKKSRLLPGGRVP